MRGAQTHAERLKELNFKAILHDIPAGNRYRITGSGRLVSLDDPWNPKVIKFNFNFSGSSPPFHPDILNTEGIGRLKRTHYQEILMPLSHSQHPSSARVPHSSSTKIKVKLEILP